MLGVPVVALSLAGVTTLAGWVPGAQSQTSTERPVQSATAAVQVPGDGGKALCATCGVVEAVRIFEVRAESRASGDGQRPPGTRTSYRVTVKMADGSYRTLAQPNPPVVGIGDRVRVAGGAVVRDE